MEGGKVFRKIWEGMERNGVEMSRLDAAAAAMDAWVWVRMSGCGRERGKLKMDVMNAVCDSTIDGNVYKNV